MTNENNKPFISRQITIKGQSQPSARCDHFSLLRAMQYSERSVARKKKRKRGKKKESVRKGAAALRSAAGMTSLKARSPTKLCYAARRVSRAIRRRQHLWRVLMTMLGLPPRYWWRGGIQSSLQARAIEPSLLTCSSQTAWLLTFQGHARKW